MTCWALLALKPPHLGKTRLAGVLSRTQRERLIRVMFERVLGALDGAEEIDRVAVITPALELLPRGVIALDDPGAGLNHALGEGRRQLIARGADEVLVLHADLPALTATEVDDFVRQGRRASLALAADRHGSGTNAILLAGRGDFNFRFGAESFARHLNEARTRGLEPARAALPGFAADIDEAADLQDFTDTHGSLLAPNLAPWSTTRWTPSPKTFLLLHAAEHG